MSSLPELMAQKEALEKRIADARRAERAEAIQQIKTLMDQYGLSVADLSVKGNTGRARKGSKVPAKYRNPASGDSWSGRGLQPKWLKAALSAGRKIDEFKV